MKENLNNILEDYHEEMILNLQELLKIKSVISESEEGAPFGRQIQEALEFAIKMGNEKKFDIVNFDNYACEMNFGQGEESVGIMCHLDVVPEGDGWKYPPFGGVIADGKIYGRGAVDDKGAFIAAFYACLALRESGLPLSKKIKHIVGTNEEGGTFPCIQYYKAHGEVPSAGIVPDSWFPVAYAEKGILTFQYQMKPEPIKESDNSCLLIMLKGGEAVNVVPPFATAKLTGSQSKLVKILDVLEASEFKEKLKWNMSENEITITAIGKSAHASTPEIGINAISILLKALSNCEFEPHLLQKTIKNLATLVACDSDGTGLAIACSDNTGALTNNVGLLNYEGEYLTLKMNIRSPITLEIDGLEKNLKKGAEKIGMEYSLINYNHHFYVSPEEPIIKTLVKVYQNQTGDLISKPKAHGGGSYARILDNFIPFGPSIEGEELCFHKQDEHISCDRLLLLSKIYAEALYELAK